MNVQMEEHIHAAQTEALLNVYGATKKEFTFYALPDQCIMEVEAKTHIQETKWPLMFGTLPPLIMDVPEKPEGFDEKLPRLRELTKKDIKKHLIR
ncbi:MAG: hypothetical protein OXO49_01705 [Gammaproteobacteria bacterium]|nr:hypothetical protein [Gammaproteobacteria bacterium]MDE0252537.1 hypothetical protein [Gammaproteobacteria bacterium]MDE0402979.1 hypothetical protein [Gammaproteobacteria bacterium]